jgi:hypothetical protein
MLKKVMSKYNKPKIEAINVNSCILFKVSALDEKIFISLYLYKYSTMDEYYTSLNYSPTHLLEMMYNESVCLENYYLSPVNVMRCDVSQELRTELSKIINAPFSDCGFLKTKPLQQYPIHIDAFRVAAINMPLFEETVGFKSIIFTGQNIETINYIKNYFTLLNVMKPHGVTNSNLEKERIMLSIGFKNNSYEDLIRKFKDKLLINDIL